MTSHLVGLTEIAELLGVSRQRVDQLSKAYTDFPRPEADLASGRVWSKAAIEGWLAMHPERAPGRVEGEPVRFDRFTPRARAVFTHAQKEAATFNHTHVGCEHLLLGILHETEGLGAKALSRAGLTLDRARGTLQPGSISFEGARPFTPRAHRALVETHEAALELGHNYIGTEHMVLGILREGENLAVGILKECGIDPVTVRAALTEDVGLPPEQPSGSLPPWESLRELLGRIESRLERLERRLSGT